MTSEWFNFTRDVDVTNYLAGIKVDAEDIEFTIAEVVTATTLTADHFLILVNANVDLTLTLPAAASHNERVYTIKNVSSNKITIKGDSSAEKIDGEDEIELTLQKQAVTIACSSTEILDSNWHIIGGEYVKMEDLLNQMLEAQKGTTKELELLNERYEDTWKTEITKEDIEDVDN